MKHTFDIDKKLRQYADKLWYIYGEGFISANKMLENLSSCANILYEKNPSLTWDIFFELLDDILELNKEELEYYDKLTKEYPNAPIQRPFSIAYKMAQLKYWMEPTEPFFNIPNKRLFPSYQTGLSENFYNESKNLPPVGTLGTLYYTLNDTDVKIGFHTINLPLKKKSNEVYAVLYEIDDSDLLNARNTTNSYNFPSSKTVLLKYVSYAKYKGWTLSDANMKKYGNNVYYFPRCRWDSFETSYIHKYYKGTGDFYKPEKYYTTYFARSQKRPSPPKRPEPSSPPKKSPPKRPEQWERGPFPDWWKDFFGYTPQYKQEESSEAPRPKVSPPKQGSPLKTLGLLTKSDYRKWLLKNHPDKGGDPETAKWVIREAQKKGW